MTSKNIKLVELYWLWVINFLQGSKHNWFNFLIPSVQLPVKSQEKTRRNNSKSGEKNNCEGYFFSQLSGPRLKIYPLQLFFKDFCCHFKKKFWPRTSKCLQQICIFDVYLKIIIFSVILHYRNFSKVRWVFQRKSSIEVKAWTGFIRSQQNPTRLWGNCFVKRTRKTRRG